MAVNVSLPGGSWSIRVHAITENAVDIIATCYSVAEAPMIIRTRTKINGVYSTWKTLANDAAIVEALAKKAPTGYGYGGKSTWIAFWDDADGSKLKTKLEDMYAEYRDTVIRIKLVDYPICRIAGNGGWADIFFGDDSNTKTIVVRYHTVTNFGAGPSTAVLMCKEDVWGEWEYENPPRLQDIEYLTTERIKDKPVYVKSIKIPVSAITSQVVHYEHNIPNFGTLVDLQCSYSADRIRPIPASYYGNAAWNAQCIVTSTEFMLELGQNVLDRIQQYNNGIDIIIKYTKG